ncbi:MAG: 4-hydroxy-2-oxovalerate aldolase [Solirubrobacterales bacterium]
MITLVDSTLRDGSHAKRHRWTSEDAAAIAAALAAARVPIVEVSHGDGLGGSSFTYGFSLVEELELIRAAAAATGEAETRVAVLLLPGIGTKDHLELAREAGAEVIRVATHCTEADISESHLARARELGFATVGFLMMAHMNSPEGLLEQARIMVGAGAEAVYVTDSAGALVPDQVRARVAALREGLAADVGVGFHGHENLGLGVGNSVAAAEAGATWIDGCTRGIGAGAGNAATELLAAALERSGHPTGVDVLAMMDVAEDVVGPRMDRPRGVERSALLLGYAGVYSSFLLHAERAAERFGVSPKDILLEVGERRAVGGQEDLIIDIAAELAAR